MEAITCFDRKWDTPTGVTTDVCPNLTWKNVGLEVLKRVCDLTTKVQQFCETKGKDTQNCQMHNGKQILHLLLM